MGQDVGLQLRQPAQGKTVHFNHVVQRDCVGRGFKIAHVGHQELQGIADAPVGVDHTGQDFVVTRDVAGIVTGGYPKTHDFGAQLLIDHLGLDPVAQALAHLAALGVYREPVRQDAAVGGPVIHGTGR